MPARLGLARWKPPAWHPAHDRSTCGVGSELASIEPVAAPAEVAGSRDCSGGTMRSSRRLTLTLVAVLLAWFVGVAVTQAADDTWTATKIRIALMTTDGAGRDAVKVDVEHGKVTLHGTVDSQAVKDKAEATARAVGGVTEVRNLLQVVKESRQKAVKAADKDVKEAVEKLLKADKSLEGIKVKSVDDGVVFLDGTATSLAAKLRAIEAVYGIPGVMQVASGIEAKE
jgi:osmotically-inducible protein OsmY